MRDIQRILFPTDFSATARGALHHALMLTKEFGARLYMLHVAVLGETNLGEFEEPFPMNEDLFRRLFDLADSEFGEFRRMPEAKTIEIVEEKRRGYAPGPVILDYAKEIDADLIVMGSHGRRGPARWLLGSVAEKVLRHAACPVVTVRWEGKEKPETGTPQHIENILVPLDFSGPANIALTAGKELADRFGAALQLLHVVDVQSLPAFYGPAIGEITDRLTRRSQVELRLAFESTPGPEVPYTPRTVAGRAAAGILDFAEGHDTDLIVIPSRGLAGLDRWLLGSTAERVARAASCPVLTLKQNGEPGTEAKRRTAEALANG